jgi:hypothetical protein
MNRLKDFSLTFLFLSSIGIGGGILFLFYIIVPFEQFLSSQGYGQYTIDSIIKYFVYGWIIIGLYSSYKFHVIMFVKNRKIKLASMITVFTMSSAIFLSIIFLNTNNELVANKQSERNTEGQFTFGPYPNLEDLERLKADGYDGIITLLSPLIPMENSLLQKETVNGQVVGLEIHSFPMLPWIGNNKDSLDAIKYLIKGSMESGKKYYVHCYLGRHRVEVAKQVILKNAEQKSSKPLTVFPSVFERGNLYFHNDNKIILGPLPSDEEWLTRIQISDVKEVVVIHDDLQSGWVQKVRSKIIEMGLKFTFFGTSKEPTEIQLKRIQKYVHSLDHTVFIHGYHSEGKVMALNAFLRTGHPPIFNSIVSKVLDKSNYHFIGSRFLYGQTLNENQLKKLRENNIKNFIHIQNKNSDIAPNHYDSVLTLSHQPTIEELYHLSREFTRKPSFYISCDDTEICQKLAEMTTHMVEGIEQLKYRHFILGELPNKNWNELMLSNGITKILYLHAPSLNSEEELNLLKVFSKSFNINLKIINLFENYKEQLLNELNNDHQTTYVIVHPYLQVEIKNLLHMK